MVVHNWSNLLRELIEIISRKLTNYADYVRFRAVCVNWRSNSSPIPHYFQYPWLMLPFEPHNENHRCGFFSLLENKIVHQLNIPNTHPAAQSHCCGSSQGWLLLIEERSPNLFLFNPLTRIQIHLPPLTTFSYILDFNILNVGKEYLVHSPHSPQTSLGLDFMHRYFILRFSLSSKNPTSLHEDYIVVVIIGSKQELAFCKKGDEKWTMMKDDRVYNAYDNFQDVIYYKGLFYAVNDRGYVTICDVSSSSPSMTIIASPSARPGNDKGDGCILYLVDSFDGELLLVHRFLLYNFISDDPDCLYQTTEDFEVFRFDSSKPKWVKVKSLNDCMLFLGANSSLCLSTNDFPTTCEENCIYFTRAHMYGLERRWKNDMGVFNVGNGSMKALSCYSTGSDQILLPPLLWLTPNPC